MLPVIAYNEHQYGDYQQSRNEKRRGFHDPIRQIDRCIGIDGRLIAKPPEDNGQLAHEHRDNDLGNAIGIGPRQTRKEACICE